MVSYYLQLCVLFSFGILLPLTRATHKGEGEGTNAEKRLIDDLFKHYNPMVRPVRNLTTTVPLKIGLFMTMIESLDEKEQILKAVVWIKRTWVDEFLTWNPAEYDGLDHLYLPSKEIWIPDVGLLSSVGSIYDALRDNDYNVLVSNTGNVDWYIVSSIKVYCLVDLTYMPFDNQTCELYFMNWVHEGTEVNITSFDSTNEFGLKDNGEWTELKTEHDLSSIIWEGIHYRTLKVWFHLKRKPTYIMWNLMVPSLLMAIMSSLLFILPAEAGEKVSLGITILLSFTVFLLVIAENTPRSSRIPLISIFLLAMMIMAGTSLALTVLVLRLHHQRIPVPQLVRTLVFGCMAKMVCYKIPKNDRKDLYFKNEYKESKLENGEMEILKNAANSSFSKEINAKIDRLENYLQYFQEHIRESEKSDAEDWRHIAAIVDKLLLFLFWLLLLLCSLTILVFIPAMNSPF